MSPVSFRQHIPGLFPAGVHRAWIAVVRGSAIYATILGTDEIVFEAPITWRARWVDIEISHVQSGLRVEALIVGVRDAECPPHVLDRPSLNR